jgi:hypothetical protein
MFEVHLGAEPIVYGAGALTAAVLNHLSGLREADARSDKLVIFGRAVEKP